MLRHLTDEATRRGPVVVTITERRKMINSVCPWQIVNYDQTEVRLNLFSVSTEGVNRVFSFSLQIGLRCLIWYASSSFFGRRLRGMGSISSLSNLVYIKIDFELNTLHFNFVWKAESLIFWNYVLCRLSAIYRLKKLKDNVKAK